MSDDRKWARLLRLGVVGQMYRSGELTKEDVVDCLKSNLNPGDDSTFADDSGLLDKCFEEALSAIDTEEKSE